MRQFQYMWTRMKFSRFTLQLLALLLAGLVTGSCKPKQDESSADQPAKSDADPLELVSAPAPLSFNKDIRPILSDQCFACHGFDPKTREEDLRLDTQEGATRDLGGYAAIVPGNRKKSEVWIRITDDVDPMPPEKYHGQGWHKRLSKEEIELIGRWIDEGASYEDHWAYTPIVKPKVPKATANPIDGFIQAKLSTLKVKPSPQADKRTLLRRVTFDLTGLPPTREQAAAFMEDESSNAYEKFVDQLMASETYGEHLAVWWLDLVRYADTIGIHSDNPRNVWPYRDWVIKSLNENMPYNQFSIMQLAGDLMQEEPTQDQLIASAYNRLNLATEEGGAQAKEYQVIYNVDRVTNYGEVWLGSSTGCAQCHDHKFDPISMEDFYTLAAFFGSLNGAAVGQERGYPKHEPPYIFLPKNDAEKEQIAEVEKRYREFIDKYPDAPLLDEYFGSRSQSRPALPEGGMPAWGKDFEKLLGERAKLAEKIDTIPVARDLPNPRIVRILERGSWQDESGKIVEPATPAFLNGPRSTEDKRLTRLDLAKWTVSKDNPLASRAVVNRLWARYMGHPLSSNPIDLGSQGTAPTHPDLLNWMASEFMEGGWDLKRIVKLIVTSDTYKQSSNVREELADIDPDNTELFARQSAVRLSAESMRDQALTVSGLLETRVGGPSVFPYQPDGHWNSLNFPKRKWPTSKGEDLYRRGMYTWVQRSFPHPQMVTFDAPSRESCTGERFPSTTPLQALASLNGPVFIESARVMAQSLIIEKQDDAKRLEVLYDIVLSRAPREEENSMLMELLGKQREHFSAKPEAAAKLAAAGTAPPVSNNLNPVEVAAWTSLCRVVLNLHETVTRN